MATQAQRSLEGQLVCWSGSQVMTDASVPPSRPEDPAAFPPPVVPALPAAPAPPPAPAPAAPPVPAAPERPARPPPPAAPDEPAAASVGPGGGTVAPPPQASAGATTRPMSNPRNRIPREAI